MRRPRHAGQDDPWCDARGGSAQPDGLGVDGWCGVDRPDRDRACLPPDLHPRAALPDLFGTAHLGSIRGIVTVVTVVGTAVAPIILSLGNDLTGSYLPALRWLLLLPGSVVVLAVVADRVRLPPTPGRPGRMADTAWARRAPVHGTMA